MRINGYIGDKTVKGVGGIPYTNSQEISYFYVTTRTAKDPSDKAGENIPDKKSYEDLKNTYRKNGLILMDYYKGGTLNIDNGYRYGVMTTPSQNYLNAISIYKKEIWHRPNPLDPQRPIALEEDYWHLVTDKTEADIIYDFNIGNNRYYKYLYRFVYFGKKDSIITSNTVLTEGLNEVVCPIRVRWDGWSLTELHEVENSGGTVYRASLKDVWKFKYNVSPGDFTQNLSKTSQETLAQFPKFVHGPKNTITGSVNCLLGREVVPFDWMTVDYIYKKYNSDEGEIWGWCENYDFNGYNAGGYKEELWPDAVYSNLTSNKQMDMLNHWRAFCYSGNPKLLRDNQGHRFIVQVHDVSSHEEEGWNGRPITISFSWTQIKNADDITVLEEI